MSAFEVVVTPPRQKNARKVVEAREPTSVVLAPFSSKSVVAFDDIPITKTARRFLCVQNPTNEILNVSVTKTFDPELNLSLEWSSMDIAAGQSVSMEIVWIPSEEVHCRKSLQFRDNRNFKKDVFLFFKSIDKKHGNKRVPVTTKLKLKGPSPPKRFKPKIVVPVTVASNENRIDSAKPAPILYPVELNEINNLLNFSAVSPLALRNSNLPTKSEAMSLVTPPGKENKSPQTPLNASAIFDKIAFTPVTETKKSENIDYLASLPTPKSTYPAIQTNTTDLMPLVKEAVVVVTSPPKHEPKNLYDLETPKGVPINETASESFRPIVCSSVRRPRSLSHIVDGEPDRKQMLFDIPQPTTNATFKICDGIRRSISPQTIRWSPKAVEGISDINRADSCQGLTAILEVSGQSETAATFHVSPSHEPREIKPLGTPLRKKFQSMKDLSNNNLNIQQQLLKMNQGSMPNLNEYDEVKALENNRYFHQNLENELNPPTNLNISASSTISTISTQSIIFNKNEIKAQSSRFNINELDVANNDIYATNSFMSGINERDDCFIAPKRVAMVSSKRLGNSKKMPSGSIQKRNHSEISRCEQQKRRRSNSLTDDSGRSSSSSQSSRLNYTGAIRRRSSMNTTQLILKKQNDERVIMFDPDHHIQSLINPDPFAATTTSDPFLASTMYLDEKNIDKNETHFLKWLNALVTIPDEFITTPKQMDFGKLFNEVRNKDLTLPATKDIVSSNYLTRYRLDSLRKAAIKLFVSDELRAPFERLAVHIERKLIAIRCDRDLHLDIVLQRDILELLLCFNPIWLRIGLEIVYGEQIFMQHNSDVFSLSVFIINRLFKDRYLEEKYSRSYAKSQEYSDHIKRFTLRKLLMLLVFLDKAKNKKLIVHNPCLFLKSSPYKETKDILLKISTPLLANVGDIQRDLKRIGIVFTHKQSYLEEFNYGFRNLAIDLRDGIRLTKVMEIILLRNDLVDRLRVPAISKLQKVHNVNLALQALKAADFNLTGHISGNDIVDGHREKTLSLLWQIIYKFRSPKFNAAAITIQKWWRKSWLHVIIKRRIAEKLKQRRIKAAIVIQSAFHGLIARRYTQIYRTEKTTACLILQTYWRRYKCVKNYRNTRNSILCIQKWYRTIHLSKSIRAKYLKYREASLKIQQWYRRIIFARKIESIVLVVKALIIEMRRERKSATIIQQKFRAFILMKKQRKEFLEIRSATICIQTRYRALMQMYLERSNYLQLRQAAIRIQQAYKARNKCIITRAEFQKLKSATIVIQQKYRSLVLMKRTRAEYLRVIKSITFIQQVIKSKLLMRKDRAEYLNLKRIAILVQRKYRAKKTMDVVQGKFAVMKSSAIKIQNWYRATVQMQIEKANYVRLKQSAVVIQRRWQATLTMRTSRQEYLRQKFQATILQRQYRALIAMRIEREIYANKRRKAISIQRYYRSYILMRKQRMEFVEMKQATIVIQQHFKAFILMKHQRKQYLKLKQMVLVCQRQLRATKLMQKQRKDFVSLRQAAISIQRRFRAKLQMRQQRQVFLNLKASAVVVQRQFKALLAMRAQRSNYLIQHKSILLIQRYYRSYLCKKRDRIVFIQKRQLTIRIQRYFRTFLLMKNERTTFLKLQQMVIVCQQRFRANKSMQEQKYNFQQLKSATILIQRKFRANLYMKRQRQTFLLLKSSSIVIQRQYKSILEMRLQRTIYQRKRKSAILIQRYYRSYLLMNIERAEFTEQRTAAICIQRYYRATQAKRIEQTNYQKMRVASIIIQRYWWAYKLMKTEHFHYTNLKKSIVFCQQKYRAKKLMEKHKMDFLHLKCATIFIQQKLRAYLKMKQQRDSFLLLKSSTIIIQRKFRAMLAMRNQRSEFLKCLKSISLIQRYYRGYLSMKIEQRKFINKRNAAIIIQQYFRAVIARRMEQKRYQTIRAAAIKIQLHFSLYRSMKIHRLHYLKLRQTVIFCQQQFRANKLMQKERNVFLQLRRVTISIQQKYKAKRVMQRTRKQYLNTKMVVNKLQARARGFLARQQFQALQTPEYLEQRKREKAARLIQSYWRGHAIRKNQPIQIKLLRNKIILVNRSACPQNSVRNKIVGFIKTLNGRYNAVEEFNVLIKLVYLSRVSPQFLVADSEFVANFCYAIMSQAIRSEVDKRLIEACSYVILNLARFELTREISFLNGRGLVTIAQILLRWCDKNCAIFDTLCSVIWVYSQCDHMRNQIREFMTTPDAVFMLRETKRLVARKEIMKRNQKKQLIVSAGSTQRQFPMIKPDFGLPTKKAYIFLCSVFAFDTILSQLQIQI